jgi:hypothetical protein
MQGAGTCNASPAGRAPRAAQLSRTAQRFRKIAEENRVCLCICEREMMGGWGKGGGGGGGGLGVGCVRCLYLDLNSSYSCIDACCLDERQPAARALTFVTLLRCSVSPSQRRQTAAQQIPAVVAFKSEGAEAHAQSSANETQHTAH